MPLRDDTTIGIDYAFHFNAEVAYMALVKIAEEGEVIPSEEEFVQVMNQYSSKNWNEVEIFWVKNCTFFLIDIFEHVFYNAGTEQNTRSHTCVMHNCVGRDWWGSYGLLPLSECFAEKYACVINLASQRRGYAIQDKGVL